MLEIDLHAKCKAVAGIELPLVVVAEPMMLWPAGNRSERRETGRIRLRVELFKKIGGHDIGALLRGGGDEISSDVHGIDEAHFVVADEFYQIRQFIVK